MGYNGRDLYRRWVKMFADFLSTPVRDDGHKKRNQNRVEKIVFCISTKTYYGIIIKPFFLLFFIKGSYANLIIH